MFLHLRNGHVVEIASTDFLIYILLTPIVDSSGSNTLSGSVPTPTPLINYLIRSHVFIFAFAKSKTWRKVFGKSCVCHLLPLFFLVDVPFVHSRMNSTAKHMHHRDAGGEAAAAGPPAAVYLGGYGGFAVA